MRLDRSLLSGVVLGGLLLTGCSTFAVYEHPVTHDRMECESSPGFTDIGPREAKALTLTAKPRWRSEDTSAQALATATIRNPARPSHNR